MIYYSVENDERKVAVPSTLFGEKFQLLVNLRIVPAKISHTPHTYRNSTLLLLISVEAQLDQSWR